MGWVVLFLVFWLSALVLVPAGEWKRMWPAGAVGLVTVYVIDSTLAGLGAFSYSRLYPGLSGLPVFYLLGIPASSILLAYYYPEGTGRQVGWVALVALVFLLVELAMVRLNYFHYLSWSPVRSYLLDLGGLIVVLWTARKAGAVGRGSRAGG